MVKKRNLQIQLKKKKPQKALQKFTRFKFLFCIEQYPFFFKKSFKKLKYVFKLRIKANNIFASLVLFSPRAYRTIKYWSCGLQKLNVTKRKLKFIANIFLLNISKFLKKYVNYIVCIQAPRYLYKFLFKKLKLFRMLSTILLFNSMKIFNGCRAKKQRRKKHARFRALK